MFEVKVKQNIDMIFSVGRACRPAYHLQKYNFRAFASPFDWQMAYSLETVLHLFVTGFSDFFKEIEEDESYPGAYKKVWDTKNKICSVHFFERDKDIYDSQVVFREIMKKRFDRLDKRIRKSNTIAMICNRDEEEEVLVEFLQKFGKVYPNKKMILINVYDQKIPERKKSIVKIDDFLELHLYTFDDISVDKTRWKGDAKHWEWVLSHYSLGYRDDIEQCKSYLSVNKKIIVYGAGVLCPKIINYLESYDVHVSGIAVSSMQGNIDQIEGIKVKSIEEYDFQECVFIISIKDENIRNEIIKNLEQRNRCQVGYFNYKFGAITFIEN